MARQKEFDRTRALDRAMQLFWCRGYEATSIQDLVEHMGINRGSLYDTFGDKAALFGAALERYEELMGAQIRATLSQPGSAKAALRAVFDQVVAEAVDDPRRRGCMMVNAAVELAGREPALAARAATSVTQTEAALAETVIRGQRAGEISARHDPAALAQFLMNTLQGLRVMAKARPDRAALQAVVDVALSILD